MSSRPIVLTKSGKRKEIAVTTNYSVSYSNMLHGPAITIAVTGFDEHRYQLEMSKQAILDLYRMLTEHLKHFEDQTLQKPHVSA